LADTGAPHTYMTTGAWTSLGMEGITGNKDCEISVHGIPIRGLCSEAHISDINIIGQDFLVNHTDGIQFQFPDRWFMQKKTSLHEVCSAVINES
jgi:hypothetical protein